MLPALVFCEVARVPCRVFAVLARERLLTGVRPKVHVEGAFLGRAKSAHRAQKRLFARMSSHVFLQVGFVRSAVVAFVAGVLRCWTLLARLESLTRFPRFFSSS